MYIRRDRLKRQVRREFQFSFRGEGQEQEKVGGVGINLLPITDQRILCIHQLDFETDEIFAVADPV